MMMILRARFRFAISRRRYYADFYQVRAPSYHAGPRRRRRIQGHDSRDVGGRAKTPPRAVSNLFSAIRRRRQPIDVGARRFSDTKLLHAYLMGAAGAISARLL